MIPESFIQELKYRLDIADVVGSYVNLKRAGRTFKGLCPFHSEKTPSFTVYPETQSYYCFGCGAGGDLITFIMQIEHLDYPEAIRALAQRAGLQVPEDAADSRAARQKATALAINREAAYFYHGLLSTPQGQPGLRYLRGRGLSDQTIRHFGLGYAPEGWQGLVDHLRGKGFSPEEMVEAAVAARGRNGGVYDLFRGRVMFPIVDLRANVIGFGGRVLGEGGPKYLNSPDTPVFKKSRNLFALNYAKATKEPAMLLAEGYMDVIALHQAGFDNAVATLGTAITPEQARILSGYTGQVIVTYDADDAGQKAARRAVSLLSQVGVKVRVLVVENAKDPDEYIKKFGAARFRMLMEGSASATEYEIGRLRRQFDLGSDEGRVAYLQGMCQLLAGLSSPVEREVYLARAAAEAGIPKEAMAAQVASIRKKQEGSRRRAEQRDLRSFEQLQPGAGRDPERMRNLRVARAEDMVLVILMKNPDYYGAASARLQPEDFVTSMNRGIAGELFARLAAGKPAELMDLSGGLDEAQTAHLSSLLARAGGRSYSREELAGYMDVLLQHKQEKTAAEVAKMDDEETAQYIRRLSANKKKGRM